MTNIERTCPRCGLVFSSEHLDDLCPGCLIKHSFDDVESSGTRAFWEDEPEEIKTDSGRSFSHFEILEELGRGGMGVVFRVRDHSTARIVALKVLQAQHLEVPDLVQRFRSEVRAVTSLDHPHVLPIHEVGEHDGIPFFSMKLTTGGSLAQRLGDFLGKPREAARVLAKIARGVQHAHERGILHRDLKPGNILLDAAGEPYVADFGLAKWLEEDRNLTVTAAVLGTPHYIAPEQASGSKTLTTAVDIYSLGAILYELLTGRPPYVGKTVIETLRQASENTPQRPSSLVHNVPRDLETICLKCLEREPLSRYPTAGLLADDLENWLSGRPIRARHVNAAGQLWRWAKRNPLPATLVASLLLTLIAASIISTVFAVKANAAERDAKEKLYLSLLAQSKASRLTGLAGQRFSSLESMARAAQIHASKQVRDEVTASLALPDLQIKKTWSLKTYNRPWRSFDATLTTIAEEIEPGVVRISKLEDGSEITRFDDVPQSGQARQRVDFIRYSSKDLLAVRYADGVIKVWKNGQKTKLFEIADCPPLAKASFYSSDFVFSRNAQKLAVVKGKASVAVLDAATGRVEAELQPNFRARCLAFSPDGSQLAIATDVDALLPVEPKLQIWNVTTKQLTHEIITPGPAYDIAWKADASELAVGSRDSNIYVYDLETNEKLGTLSGHRQEVTQVLFTPSGNNLISTSRDTDIRLWSLSSFSQQVVLNKCGNEPAMRLSEDGSHLAATEGTSTAYLIDITDSSRVFRYFANDKARTPRATLVGSLAFSPDDRFVATASYESIDIWDLRTNRLFGSFPIDPDEEKSVRFFGDSSTLLVGSRKSGLVQYRLSGESGNAALSPIKVVDASSDFIFSNTPPGDQNLVAMTSSIAGEARIVKLNTGQQIFLVKNVPSIWDLAISPNQRWAALACRAQTGARTGDTQVWSIESKTLLATLPTGPGGTVRFSSDGKWLKATSSTIDKTWSTTDWKPARINFAGLNHAFSLDKKWAVSHVDDHIQLSNAETGSTWVELTPPLARGKAFRFAFSSHSDQVAAQSSDNTLYIWNIIELAKELQERHLD